MANPQTEPQACIHETFGDDADRLKAAIAYLAAGGVWG